MNQSYKNYKNPPNLNKNVRCGAVSINIDMSCPVDYSKVLRFIAEQPDEFNVKNTIQRFQIKEGHSQWLAPPFCLVPGKRPSSFSEIWLVGPGSSGGWFPLRVMLRLSRRAETREVLGLSGGIGGRNGCGLH